VGTPKRTIQPAMKVNAQSAAAVTLSGKASAHRLEQSTTINKYAKPSLEHGKGPTKSTWMCENHAVGTGIGCTGAADCFVTLVHWHCWQLLHQLATTFSRLGQRYLLLIKRLVALMPG
jgi:hypothetical protein